MIVCPEVKWTDKNGHPKEGIYLDRFVIEAADATIKRVCSREQDILFIFTGSEGSGKTNASVCMAYYMAKKSGRPFNAEHIFFDIDEMMKFAGSTKEQIIVWDEAALGGLAASWSDESQKKLKSMLMVCRKLRHIFIFNIPRFYRLAPDIIERCHCLFWIFEDDHEEPGNFMIIGKEGLENLYQQWRRTRYAHYMSHSSMPNPGHFDWYMPYLIDYQKYSDNKDVAILRCVTETKQDKIKRKIIEREEEIVKNLIKFGVKMEIVQKAMGISRATAYGRKSKSNVRKLIITPNTENSEGDDCRHQEHNNKANVDTQIEQEGVYNQHNNGGGVST